MIFNAVTVIVNELLLVGHLRAATSQKIVKPGVQGDTLARDSSVGTVLLGVNDHLMGGPGLAHHDSLERLR